MLTLESLQQRLQDCADNFNDEVGGELFHVVPDASVLEVVSDDLPRMRILVGCQVNEGLIILKRILSDRPCYWCYPRVKLDNHVP